MYNVYIYICIYIYMYVCVCVYLYIYMCVCLCVCVCIYICLWRYSPQWARASSFMKFLDHIQRGTTLGRTPLDE